VLSDPVAHRLIGPGSPFELTTRTLGRTERQVFRHAPATLSDLYGRALKRADNELVAFGDRRLTFRQAWDGAEGLASLLSETWKVRPRARVAIALGNGPEWLSAFLAITMLGATPVLIGRRSPADTHKCIVVSRPSLVLADSGRTAGSHDCNDAAPACLDIRELLAGAVRAPRSKLPMDDAVSADDAAVVLFTSGSTGTPKAVVLSHLNLMSGLMNMMLASALATTEAHDRPLTVGARRVPCALIHTPLSYIGGLSAVLLAIYGNSKIVVTGEWNTDAIAHAIVTENVTALSHVGKAQMEELMKREGVIAGLSSIGLHGARVPRGLTDQLAASFPALRFVSGYGLTETAGSIAVISGRMLRERPESSGLVVPTVAIDVRPTDHAGEKERVGELFVSGACVMRGYLNGETPEAGEWFCTGDVAHVSADGHLYIDYRSNESSLLSARGISVAAVERRLNELRGVSEVSLLVRKQQERVLVDVAVEVSPGCEVDSCLIEQALTPIIGAAAEMQVHLCESFPRTESGKVNRAALQASLAVRADQSAA
jgi:long-chain acyl-CoA synthetase